MKPNFALSLSFDGIRLLRRAYLGWHPVGDVGLDVPDLGAALADLREKAQEFAPAGMTTKLVIPSDQIKFLEIEQPDDWAENKDAILRAALENATPYDVSELVYDWSAQGGRVQIAAVARETLAEAEAFAAEHNFAPVSFVALPEDAQFTAEPFFGETSQAAEHMPRKAKVERDMGKIRVIPAPQPAAPEPDSAPEAEPEEDTQPEPSDIAAADEIRDNAAPDTTASETAFTPAAAGEPAEDEAEGTAEAAETVPATSGKPSRDAAPEETPDAIAGDGTEGTASDAGASDEPKDGTGEDDADPVAPTPPPPGAVPKGTSVFAMAASAADATRPPDADDAALTNAQGPGEPAASNGSDEGASGFATIRAKRDADAALAVPRLKGVSRLSGLAAAAAPGAGADVVPPPAMTDPPLTRGPSETPHRESNGAIHGTDKKADKKAGVTNGTDLPADDVDAMFSLTPANGSGSKVSPPEIKAPDPAAMSPAETTAKAAAATKPDSEAEREPEPAPEAEPAPAAPSRPGFASRRSVDPERAAKGTGRKRGKGNATHAPAVEDEKQRMTVFGAREQQVGGKPRYLGLILTAVLLLFLVGVAAWASIFLDDGLARFLGGPKDSDVAGAPGVTEDPIDEATGNLPTPNRVVTAAPSAEAAGLGSALDDEPLPDLARFISPDEALAQYAATGIWQMAPLAPDAPASGQLDDLGVARDIPPVARPALTTLPAQLAALTDLPPARPGTQATPDIRLDVEPQTLITATPEGVLSADGVLIISGRPEVEPPRVMTRADLPEGETPQADTLAETPELGTPAVDDPALAVLAALRPRPRPEGAVPEGQAEDQADTPEDTPADDTADAAADAARDAATSELAALRPRLRPASVEAIAAERDAAAHRAEQEAATAAPDDASIQAALASASTAGLGNGIRRGSFDNPTPQAVTVSLTPKFRPRGLAAKAKAAQEAAAARPVEASQVLAPSIPSSASVAKRATQRNVLHLRKVNLIGVYGSPSSRRALVRLPSGRYKKVKIGDRLDGGQVSAIGADELRYVKRGRNLVLKMPEG